MKMNWMKVIKNVMLVLGGIGAVNWLPIGIMNFNLVQWLIMTLFTWTGNFQLVLNIVYSLAGIGGIILIIEVIKAKFKL